MSEHSHSYPQGEGPTPDGDIRWNCERTEIPWGSTLLTCPGCKGANVEIIEAEVCPWQHDDGRPAIDVGFLAHCHYCDDTFRLTLFSRGAETTRACILTEHWMSHGIWS